jgi:hypothetical protein
MSHGGKTWMMKKIIILLILLITFIAPVLFLFNYLCFTFTTSVDSRLAIVFAFLIGIITSIIFYYFGKHWLRLEVLEIIFGTIYVLSTTSLFATLFLIDNIELAFQAAQIVATTFFGGLMVAVLMFINIKTTTQRTSLRNHRKPTLLHSPLQFSYRPYPRRLCFRFLNRASKS